MTTDALPPEIMLAGMALLAIAFLLIRNWGNRTEAQADAIIDAGRVAEGFTLGCVPIIVMGGFLIVVLVLIAAFGNGDIRFTN